MSLGVQTHRGVAVSGRLPGQSSPPRPLQPLIGQALVAWKAFAFSVAKLRRNVKLYDKYVHLGTEPVCSDYKFNRTKWKWFHWGLNWSSLEYKFQRTLRKLKYSGVRWIEAEVSNRIRQFGSGHMVRRFQKKTTNKPFVGFEVIKDGLRDRVVPSKGLDNSSAMVRDRTNRFDVLAHAASSPICYRNKPARIRVPTLLPKDDRGKFIPNYTPRVIRPPERKRQGLVVGPMARAIIQNQLDSMDETHPLSPANRSDIGNVYSLNVDDYITQEPDGSYKPIARFRQSPALRKMFLDQIVRIGLDCNKSWNRSYIGKFLEWYKEQPFSHYGFLGQILGIADRQDVVVLLHACPEWVNLYHRNYGDVQDYIGNPSKLEWFIQTCEDAMVSPSDRVMHPSQPEFLALQLKRAVTTWQFSQDPGITPGDTPSFMEEKFHPTKDWILDRAIDISATNAALDRLDSFRTIRPKSPVDPLDAALRQRKVLSSILHATPPVASDRKACGCLRSKTCYCSD